jgi:putative aldouronate transport system permease protein
MGHSAVKHQVEGRQLAKKSGFLSYYNKYKVLYLLSIPGIVYFLVFRYIPLIGSVMAFQGIALELAAPILMRTNLD